MIPDYGSSELPQAFCRVAAVHGAIYVLRCPFKSLLLSPDGKNCEGVKLETGQVNTYILLHGQISTKVILARSLIIIG